jgi:DNA-binding transcriptional LysR family regulator
MQLHPESQVKLHVHNTQHVVQQVAHYEIDLGLIEGDCNHPDIEVQPWVEDELVVFCAPAHPLAAHGRASLDELTGEAWILREQGSGTRLTFDQAMRHHRSNLNIRLELEHTEAIKRAVESGLGIGCISRLALRDAFRRGSLVALDTPELDLLRQFYFIWHKQKYQTSAMREFLELCRLFTAGVRRSDEIVLQSIV